MDAVASVITVCGTQKIHLNNDNFPFLSGKKKGVSSLAAHLRGEKSPIKNIRSIVFAQNHPNQ